MNDRENDLVQYDQEEVAEAAWWSPAALLSSEASAITAFTLAVVAVVGGGFIGFSAAQAVVGFAFEPNDMRKHSIVTAMIVLLVLIWAFWLARRVLLDEGNLDGGDPDSGDLSGTTNAPAWCRHLASSAIVVSAIGFTLSAVTIIGGLAQPAQG